MRSVCVNNNDCELRIYIYPPFRIICGDFNVDFARNRHNCRHLNLFMQNLILVCPDLSSNIKYTFRRDDLTSFSWPDHVLTLGHHKHLIKGVASIDDVDNFSDHLPLVFQVNISNSLPLHTSPVHIFLMTVVELTTADHISAYCSFLDEHIAAFPTDISSCCDPSCNCHYNGIDTVCAQLLECIRIGASLTLPKIKIKRINESFLGGTPMLAPCSKLLLSRQ